LEKVGDVVNTILVTSHFPKALMASRLFSRASPLPTTYRSEVECVRMYEKWSASAHREREREKEKEAENHERCTR